MKKIIKTITLVTTGLVVGVAVGRARTERAVSNNEFLVIDIINSNLTDVINEYSKLKNKN